MSRILLHPLGPFWGAVVVMTLLGVLAKGMSGNGPAQFFSLQAILWPPLASLLVVMWVERDAARNRRTPCFDLGFFCYCFWFPAIPWYCYRVWRWRGLGLFVLIYAGMCLPLVVWNL